MLKHWKRMTAFVLAISLLSSFMVMPAFAEDTPEDTANEVVYDFDLADSNSSIDFNNGSTVAAKQSTISQLYSAGTLNWDYVSAVNTRAEYVSAPATGMDFRSLGGLRMRVVADNWSAFKIKSPGQGTYTLTLQHAVYSFGAAAGALYVLPIPAEGITDAYIQDQIMTTAPVGTVNFFDAEAASVADGHTTVAGTYTFGADAEYLFVLEATEPAEDQSDIAYMLFSQLIATEGTVAAEEAEEEAKPVALGEMVYEISMRTLIASYEVNGNDYYFLPIEGGKLLVYNLDTQQKVAEASTGISNAWGCVAGPDGMVYVSGDSTRIYKYNPYTLTGESLPAFSDSYRCANDIQADANGNLYFGTSHGGSVYKYDNATGTYIEYANLDVNGVANSCDAIAYDNGYVYANLYGTVVDAQTNEPITTKSIVKIDVATGQVVATLDITEKMEARDPDTDITLVGLTNLCIVDGILIGGAAKLSKCIAVDTATMQFVDIGIETGCTGEVSEVKDGKAYFVGYSGGLYEYDLSTKTAALVTAFSSASVTLRTAVNTFVTIDHPNLPGESIFTCSTSTAGGPVFYNLESGKRVNWTDFTDGEGAYHTVRNVTASNDGSNHIYVGAYTTNYAAIYDLGTETVSHIYQTAGQTDSQLMYNGNLYAGTYSSAVLCQVDPETNVRTNLLNLSGEYQQARIHALAAGDGKIFCGTIPKANLLGGCIAWYDTVTGETYVVPNIVHNQSVIGLVYHNGLLYGATSVSGGANSTATETEAKIFVYDVANKQKLGEFAVSIDGLTTAPFIAGIAVDANGTFWGVVSETLFTFAYNTQTAAMTFTEVLSFDKTNYNTDSSRQWFSRPILFGNNGYIYFSFDDDGGMRRINAANPADSTLLMAETPIFYALGEDGNLYYGSGTQLKMLPLNITQADREAADEVDALIDAIGGVATPANKAAVNAAVAGYAALTNTQKGLVQKYHNLTTAQRKLLIHLINALPATVTLADRTVVEQTRAAYDALPVDQRSRIPNYAVLVLAENTLAPLVAAANDQAMAAAVDSLIANIGTVTIQSEAAVIAAREAYDALTNTQKALVENYAILIAAEEALAALLDTLTIETYDFWDGTDGNYVNSAAAISAAYAAGTLNYHYVGTSLADPTSIRSRVANGSIRFPSNASGDWMAFMLRSPGAGTYAISMAHPVSSYGASVVNVYLLPANTADIAAALAEAETIGTINFEQGSSAGTTGSTEFVISQIGNCVLDGAQEYIVVFQTVTASTQRSTRYYMHLAELTLAEQEVYDFWDGTDGNYVNSAAAISAAYAAGTLNYHYVGTSLADPTSIRSRVANGSIRFPSNASGDWMAFMLRSPGAGTYAISMAHPVSSYGASVVNVYLLPANTADIAAALAEAETIGTINFEQGSSAGTTGSTEFVISQIGNCVLDGAQEYIVVFQTVTASTQRSTRYYMHLAELIFTPQLALEAG